jgi:probable addiction module antidote protein
MNKSKAKAKLIQFDAARYLIDDAAIAEYMTAVLETDDPDLLLMALGDVARAKDMAMLCRVGKVKRAHK